MSEELLNMLLNAVAEGKKIEMSVKPKEFTEEEAVERLWHQSIRYTYEGKSGMAFASAEYVFDFENLTWEREFLHTNLTDSGTIPKEAAEAFIRSAAFIVNLQETVYSTESKRNVPVETEEERYILQSDTKRLSGCRMTADDKMFKWVAETDTEEPYGPLYHALETLRKECGLSE